MEESTRYWMSTIMKPKIKAGDVVHVYWMAMRYSQTTVAYILSMPNGIVVHIPAIQSQLCGG